MRRLPVYLVLDCSGSMRGEPIKAVNDGVGLLISSLRQNPVAIETAYLSVITFATEARQVTPLQELAGIQTPEFTAKGNSAIGAALLLLCERFDVEIIKTTEEKKGDWKPLIFFLSDGRPYPKTDFEKGLRVFHGRKWGTIVCGAAGIKSNIENLKRISPENIVQLNRMDAATLSSFFKWVSASIAANSVSVSTGNPRQLPPPPEAITII